jgi:serine/threonine-protein kinase
VALPVAAPDDYIGKTVASKYRVEQMIGEGGMGKVYKAIQVALDKPVVLKVLRQALLSDERTVARFQREAKAVSRLNHPNSISVLDYGRTEDGALYIAMEYVHGKDLHHILSREWPLAESRVIRIISQVLSALADAHSASVIHRDLKPENIMVEQRRGETDFVKVLDFGIAKIVDGTNEDGPALTRAGFVCGTPEYMSPEQARGAQLDHRSDLYAVGVILYQLMSGMLPFDSDSAVGFATKHLTDIPLPPTKRRPEAKVSPAMERLIMKALAKNPDDRPQTADQFRAELLAIEKERRAAIGGGRRGTSAPSLSSVPRKVTPLDQQETRVNPHPPQHQPGPNQPSPWAGREDTVKAGPPSAVARVNRATDQQGPVPPESTMTVPTTAPNRPKLFGEGGVAVVFKVATVLLVLLALSLAALYLWQLLRPAARDTFVPGDAPSSRLWEYDVPREQLRPTDARRLADEARDLLFQGNQELAVNRLEKAWQLDQPPSTALKLGELAWQRGRLDEARGWFGRYHKDAEHGSRGLSYVEQLPVDVR